jgi:hypothetical protein
MSSVSLLKQVSKNIYLYKKHLILIFVTLLLLLFIQFILPKIKSNHNHKEGFIGTPTPSSTLSPSILSKIFFINNFDKKKFKKVYEYEMDDKRYVSFWSRPFENNYYPLGQIVVTSDAPATIADINENEHRGLKFLVKGGSSPIDYEKIWDNKNNNSKAPLSIWKVIPQKDHIAMSDIVVSGFNKPSLSEIRCLQIEILKSNKKINKAVWKNPLPKSKTKGGEDISPPNSFSIWNIGNENNGFFFAKDSYQRPDNRSDRMYDISPKILDNQELDPKDGKKIITVTLQV